MAGSRIFFSCIYLNPFFTAKECHRYDTLDNFHISPSLGLRVVIDGVFNHCSRHFFAFGDVVRNGERSQYKDWFYDLAFPVTRPPEDTVLSYTSFAYELKMPKLNTSNPEVRDYFCCVYEDGMIGPFGYVVWK